MKKLILVVILIAIILTSCLSRKVYVNVPSNENFFYSYPFSWLECKSCESNYDSYISDHFEDHKIVWHWFDKEQLEDTDLWQVVHNTVKKIGYENVISKDLYETELEGFIDSLLLWDNRSLDTSNYYSKFLRRRELQGTKKLTVEIINDIKVSFDGKQPFIYDMYVNDTLALLAKYDLSLRSKNTKISQQLLLEVFDFLKSIGEYSLAYQFSNRPFDFSAYNLSRDSLLLSLPLDTVKESYCPDNANRLGYFDKNSEWIDTYLYWRYYPGP